MITRGAEQDLLLDPGSYSVDPDASSFDASVNKSTYMRKKIAFSVHFRIGFTIITVEYMGFLIFQVFQAHY